jgi:salicylate biosynthesis isochorismate synthase/menaquinone-specific isochorismate synthase
VGWFGELGIDLRVALRSALIIGARARVYVGAGIVRGSDAAAEWKETELKSRPMLRALGVEGVDG